LIHADWRTFGFAASKLGPLQANERYCLTVTKDGVIVHERYFSNTSSSLYETVRQLTHHFWGPFLLISQLHATPHTPCEVLYLVPSLTGG